MADAAQSGAAQGAANTSQVQATAGTAGQSAAPVEWTSGFSDDMKGFVQNKGWKNAQEVADSYRNLEKSFGVPADRLLKLPESLESPDAAPVWEKLGKPKEAKGYNLQVPEKGGDPKLAEWASEIFHKGNLTASQAQHVMKEWNARQEAMAAQTVENQKAAATLAVADLKTEWGAAYDKNMNLVDQAGRVLGWGADKLAAIRNALGPKEAMKMMLDIANSTSEGKFITGQPAGDGTITPDQARSELNDLKRDQAFVAKYLSGDFDAKKRMEHLQKMANPGDMRLS
jgi:hypothetical protein